MPLIKGKVITSLIKYWIVESDIEKKTVVLYIDCKLKKTFVRKLIKWHKYMNEQTYDINQEVNIDSVEEDVDRLFIEQGLMSKGGSMSNTYNTTAMGGYNNRQSLLSADNHTHSI